MSLDIDKIKNKLKKLQSQNNGGDTSNILWKPEEGEQVIRIVPYKYNPSNPFIELYTYFDFAGETFVSPLSYGDADPIHELSQELRKQGDEESYKQSKRFTPNMRTYVPVIVRGKEREGIKYWGFGKQVYEQLLGYIADPDWGDITHPKTGRDIKVTYEVPEGWPKNRSNGFPKTTIMPKPNQTKAMDDMENFKELFENEPDIKNIFKAPTYSELEAKLNKYLGKADGNSSDNNSNTSTDNKESAPWSDNDSDEDTSSKMDSDVESTFDALFNE